MKHLVTLQDWDRDTIRSLLDRATAIKKDPWQYRDAMQRRVLVMIFEKPSLRTRVSFEVGAVQMGGYAIYYDMSTSPLGAGKENIADTVKVLSRYADIIMARLFEHAKLEEMVCHSTIPVINGLTDFSHPCQVLGDLLTILEIKGRLKGLTLAYFGDANNNVTHSLLFACPKMGMNIRIACPAKARYMPQPAVVEEARKTAARNRASVEILHDALAAARGAEVVYTDSWMSYHIPAEEQEARVADLRPFQVNSDVMGQADRDAIFMNCLPALRGYEQTAEVMDGAQSVVFDQAENRLHIQKAIMLYLLEHASRDTSAA
ncbi:MAG TPA: ornithine carbamoyltransferase [Kiritimatiellae bacterium]|nr:ornithine carbamoyltransferase [Kiritimatiellia bacterium]